MAYSIEILRQRLIERFVKVKVSHDELLVNCPFCLIRVNKQDVKKHLYINVYKNKYLCFRCEAKGYATALVRGVEYEYASLDSLASIPISSKEIESLPDNIVPIFDLDEKHPARVYLESRAENIIDRDYEIYYCDKYVRGKLDFGPRLIFPVFVDNKYYGFQARKLNDNLDESGTEGIRYISCVNFKKSQILYNWERAREEKSVIITEGIFDGIHCGDNGVAIFGKFLSDIQFNLIINAKFEKIYLFLDADALKNARMIASMLSKKDQCVYYINYKVKDPGKLSYKQIRELIDNETVYPDYGAIRVF